MPSLRVANLIRDRKLLELAKREARALVDESNDEATTAEKRTAVQYLKTNWNGAMDWWRSDRICIAHRNQTTGAGLSVSCRLEGMILGIGVDLCEVDRMEAAISRHGERFLARIYTEAERAIANPKRTAWSASPDDLLPRKRP